MELVRSNVSAKGIYILNPTIRAIAFDLRQTWTATLMKLSLESTRRHSNTCGRQMLEHK